MEPNLDINGLFKEKHLFYNSLHSNENELFILFLSNRNLRKTTKIIGYGNCITVSNVCFTVCLFYIYRKFLTIFEKADQIKLKTYFTVPHTGILKKNFFLYRTNNV